MARAWRVRVVCVAAVLVGSASRASEPHAILDAAFCARVDAPAAVLDETIAEAGDVMRDAKVALRVARLPAEECGDGAAAVHEVLVRLESGAPEWNGQEGRRPIASIHFVRNEPGRLVTLWLASARYLLHRDAAIMSLLARLPPRVEERWTGRMLGRALAHELGHYLLRAPGHSDSGLMRANHSAQALVRPDRALFQLTAAQREALHARRTAKLEGGVALVR